MGGHIVPLQCIPPQTSPHGILACPHAHSILFPHACTYLYVYIDTHAQEAKLGLLTRLSQWDHDEP